MPVRNRRNASLHFSNKALEGTAMEARHYAYEESHPAANEKRQQLPPPFPPPPPPSFPLPVVTITTVVTQTAFPSIDADLSRIKQAPPATVDPVVTMTSVVYQTVTPTVTALAIAQANPTTVLESSPSDINKPPPFHPKKGGLSEGTEHLLIAAGSIGATIIIVLLVYGIYLMKRKGLSFAEVITGRRNRTAYDPGLQVNPEAALPPYQYPDSMKSLPLEPQPAHLVRQLSNVSERPLIDRNASQRTERSALRINTTNDSAERTFYNDSSPSQRFPPNHKRNVSETPSSPVLPLQNSNDQSPSIPSTRNTRDFDPYTGQPLDQARSPPTFRQFLANRRISIAPKISRFSWNTSNAPQTPRDDLRMSVGTNRSSVPRFRTIESWVGQQTSRVQGFLTNTSASEMAEQKARGNSMFPIPDVPSEYQQEPAAPAPLRIKRNPTRRQPQPLLPDTDEDSPAPIRRDTVGAQSDATIFRQHPGTEVVIPRGSLVPSEVLNSKVKPLAL